MFDIEKKIHDIRSKPEHIRMRWVWVLVAISMIIIILIWAISLRVNLSQSRSEGSSIKDFSQSIKKSLDGDEKENSLDDLLKEGKQTIEQTKDAKDTIGDLDLEGVSDPGVSLDSILE